MLAKFWLSGLLRLKTGNKVLYFIINSGCLIILIGETSYKYETLVNWEKRKIITLLPYHWWVEYEIS